MGEADVAALTQVYLIKLMYLSAYFAADAAGAADAAAGAADEWHPLKLGEVGVFARLSVFWWVCSSDIHEIDGSECAVTASDVSLAYFGGQARKLLVLLAMFGGLTKMYSSAYFGGSAVQLGLVW